MGRNIWSVCHECEVQLMHLRGQEGKHMQRFQNDHADHEGMTEILSDYKIEAPEDYTDVYDDYNPGWKQKLHPPVVNKGGL